MKARKTVVILALVMLQLIWIVPWSLGRVDAQKFLSGRIHRKDKRYATFLSALQLMLERKAKTLVETGTARGGECNCEGDGCSTLIFARFAKRTKSSLYSVDIDPQAILEASAGLQESAASVHLVTGDSIPFLATFGKPIDFLYLDSFDYDENNPLPSQEHHLKEVEAAYPYLTKKSIVMIDDHSLPGGGKSKLALQFLKERGWKVVAEGYQVLLVRQ